MTVQIAIWIPPSLCGCQLQMTADFTEGSVANGISYRHPIPYTISDIKIVSVCAEHQAQTLAMPDTSNLFEADLTGDVATFLIKKYPNIVLSTTQRRGYLKYPLDNPTSGHNLYTYFWRYCGQTHGYPCGCRAYVFINDRTPDSPHVYLDHPLYTKKCHFHHNDTVDMQNATSDFKELSVQTGIIMPLTVADSSNQDQISLTGQPVAG